MLREAFGTSPACEWAVETTTSALDAWTADALKDLGFERIHLGIQTLDDTTRFRIGRRESGAKAMERIRDLEERGFFTSVDLIIGFSPEIVDIVVHRARYVSARHNLIPYVDASTNGVFNESRSEFIGDYFGGVVLSFDGPAEFHDRHRPAFEGRPTFDLVNRTAKRLSEMPLDLCLRVCISDDSVGEMENITRWMVQSFRPAVVNFESLTPGVLAERAGLKVPDPYRFAAHCVGAYRVAELLGVRAVYSAAEVERARLSFCPVGTDAVIVSPDGRASACYLLPEDWQARGLDMDVGQVYGNGKVVIDPVALTRARRLPLQKPRCQRCFCQWTCAGGCHVNQTYPGSTDEYTDFCIQTRLVTACLLLRDLGFDDLADELLFDRNAMEKLALQSWDAIDVGGVERADKASIRELPTPYWRGSERPRSLIGEGWIAMTGQARLLSSKRSSDALSPSMTNVRYRKNFHLPPGADCAP